jgi:hypothetical protein
VHGSEGSGEPCPDLRLRSHSRPPPPHHSTFNDKGGGGGSDMGGFPVWAPLLSWCLLLVSPPSSCHLCSTRPPIHQSHHSFPPCLIRTHSPSTHPRGISFSVSLPLVFPHLSLSLSRVIRHRRRVPLRQITSHHRISMAPTRSATFILWPLLVSLPHLICQIIPV